MRSGTNYIKVWELTYSKIQGKENLLQHYPSKIVYGNEKAFNSTPEQEYYYKNTISAISIEFNKIWFSYKNKNKIYYI